MSVTIRSPEATVFEALQQRKSLESLDVSSNLEHLEGDARTLIAFIKYTTTLRTINLSHCGITDDYVK